MDDSSFYRNRSKKVELLARCFDHASQKMRFYKGFRLLTLGWSDGATFIPLDFSLLSSKTSQINGISKLQKEFQGRSYDLLISHTTIVFSRYILLYWQNRCSVDDRTLGMFYELCDEMNELDWAVALQQLIELLEDTLKQTNNRFKKLIKSQLQQWIAGLPSYIKAYLPNLCCET